VLVRRVVAVVIIGIRVLVDIVDLFREILVVILLAFELSVKLVVSPCTV
jgi:hypothetical protein